MQRNFFCSFIFCSGLLVYGLMVRSELYLDKKRSLSSLFSASTILPGLNQVKHIIAVTSCKGGVGKSTVAVNLAYSLQSAGASVGILDADLFGPSIPTMTAPDRSNLSASVNPLNPLNYAGVKLISLGFLNSGPAIMRGPMVNQVLNQLVTRVKWGSLDYLVVDMPPGTGDIQLSLAQSMNISAAVIVTTPQKLSFVDVVKGIDMLDTVNVPCVAVVENMAEYQTYEFNELFYTELGQKIETLPKNTDKTSVASILREAVQAQRKSRRIFGEGHAARLKEMWGIETVISLPVLEEVSKCGDSGAPFVLEHPNSAFTLSMNNLAARVRQEIENLADSQYKYTLYFNHRTAMVSLESDKQKATGKEISAFDLRCACRCAACIEELTGRALLEPDKVSLLVQPIIPAPQPRNIHNQLVNKFAVGVPIGRYAVAIDWSDGHKSLFPYKQLRLLTKQQSIQETSMHVDASI